MFRVLKCILVFVFLAKSTFAYSYDVGLYYSLWSINTGISLSDVPAKSINKFVYSHVEITKDYKCKIPHLYGGAWREFLSAYMLTKKNDQLEVQISLAGNITQERIKTVIKDKALIKNLAESCLNFLKTKFFSGLTIDWEFPGKKDSEGLVNLLTEFKKSFKNDNYQLNLAIPGDLDKLKSYPFDKIEKHIDKFHLKSYNYVSPSSEFSGHHSSFKDVQASLEYLKSKNVDMKKVILGIPLYGFGWKVENEKMKSKVLSKLKSPMSYNSILSHMSKGFEKKYDKDFDGYYLYNKNKNELITYEDPEISKKKIRLSKNLGLGGVYFWELRFDTLDKKFLKVMFSEISSSGENK